MAKSLKALRDQVIKSNFNLEIEKITFILRIA